MRLKGRELVWCGWGCRQVGLLWKQIWSFVYWNSRNVLTPGAAVSSSRRSLLHWVSQSVHYRVTNCESQVQYIICKSKHLLMRDRAEKIDQVFTSLRFKPARFLNSGRGRDVCAYYHAIPEGRCLCWLRCSKSHLVTVTEHRSYAHPLT